MAAGAFFDGKRTCGPVITHRNMMQEVVVGLREILTLENTTRFFSGQPALKRGRHHANGGLGA